jgi:hypothetical protein
VNDYEPLDLSVSATSAEFPAGAAVVGGPRTFQGLPFEIPRAADGTARCVAYGGGDDQARVIPIDRQVRHVIIAHVVIASKLNDGGMVGEPIAEYVFTYADGEVATAPIRERFEIAPFVPLDLGHQAFGAFADTKPTLFPRREGAWGFAGRRPADVMRYKPDLFALWTWRNPRPAVPVVSLTVVPRGPRACIGAITLGSADEWPFVRTSAKVVKVSLLREEHDESGTDLSLDVDRGVAGYVYPLACGDASVPGWGAPRGTGPAYARVAAVPSATLSVAIGERQLGSVRWGELASGGPVDRDGVRLELVDTGRNWVRTTVCDDNGRPVPCRISFRSSDGVPSQPHGHMDHLNGEMSTWHLDVGGDLRLGQHTYAYIDGTCEGWLPRGEVIVEVARGFEHEPIRERVRIEPGQRDLTLRLRRWRDMNAEGWYSGDTHVHFLSTQGGHLEAGGEDLNVVNVLQAQWTHLFTNTEEFTGEPSVSRDGRTIVHVSQENRQHLLGHLNLLGLRRPVMPWSSDGPDEAELGGALETTLSHWADACHAQGGTVVIPHFPKPNGEPAALVATGRADAAEFMRASPFDHLEYYRYLNAGYRLPVVGGTDKMSSEVPVGLYRTYVRIPREEGFTHESWLRNLRLGRTFMSGGPLMRLSVEGREIGDNIELPAEGGTVEVEAEVASIFPIERLDILLGGSVVASAVESKGARTLRLRERIRVERSSWIAARAGAADYMQPRRHVDVFTRGILAHTSPIYIDVAGQSRYDPRSVEYMLRLVEGARHYVQKVATQDEPGMVTHHHGEADHLAFLDRPFAEADAALRERLRSGR